MAMSKEFREAVEKEVKRRLTSRAQKAASKRWEGKTQEQKVAAARSAALAKHRKLGHNMTVREETKDAAA